MLGLGLSRSAQVSGNSFHEPVHFPLPEAQALESSGIWWRIRSGRDSGNRCLSEIHLTLDMALRKGWGRGLLAEAGIFVAFC